MQLKETKAAAKELLSELPIRKPRRLKRSDITMLILSLVFALIIWLYIAVTIYTETSPKFTKLPITADITNTKASNYGLQLLPESEEYIQSMTVDCTLVGNRAAIGGLSRSDLEAYIDFDTDIIDRTGVQSLPIKIRTKNGAQFTKAEITPNRITVKMDHFTKKEVPVSDANHPNLSPDQDAIIREDKITYSPSKIEVRGPSELLNKLDHICVNLSDSETLTETKTFESGNFSYLDSDGKALTDSEGKELSSDVFEISANRFSVTIPIYYSRKFPVSVEITGIPGSIDEAALKDVIYRRLRIVSGNKTFSLPGYGEDNMTITIETSNINNKVSLEDRSSYNTLPIELSDLVPGKAITRSFPDAEGFESPDNISSVTFRLDDTDILTETRWLKNSEIDLQNRNDRFGYDLKSPDGNTQVTLCGTAEELAMVDSEDLKAYVNLINITEKGNKTSKINVILPDTVSGVWVIKPPSLALNVRDAE
ncbi:MAG: hypothetical protein IJM46_00895 [Oscillospiraceae bacterium]|nr:hypothetical protein [Oscillospiraceae bacterium]